MERHSAVSTGLLWDQAAPGGTARDGITLPTLPRDSHAPRECRGMVKRRPASLHAACCLRPRACHSPPAGQRSTHRDMDIQHRVSLMAWPLSRVKSSSLWCRVALGTGEVMPHPNTASIHPTRASSPLGKPRWTALQGAKETLARVSDERESIGRLAQRSIAKEPWKVRAERAGRASPVGPTSVSARPRSTCRLSVLLASS